MKVKSKAVDRHILTIGFLVSTFFLAGITHKSYPAGIESHLHPVIEEPVTETESFLRAKKFVLRRQWEAARELLNKHLRDYSDGHYKGEVLYWLSYSEVELSKENGNKTEAISYKKSALVHLTNLLENHTECPWFEDAEILKNRLNSQISYLEGDSEDVSNTETLSEIFALLELDKNVALDGIKQIASTHQDFKMRKVAIASLINFSDEAISVLDDILEKENHNEVLRFAQLFRQELERYLIPVHLNYNVFSGYFKEGNTDNKFPENELIEFDIPQKKIGSRVAKNGIYSYFNHLVYDLEKQASSYDNNYFNTSVLRKMLPVSARSILAPKSSMSHGTRAFRVENVNDAIQKSNDHIKGEIKFTNKGSRRKYSDAFEINIEYDKVYAMRQGENVSVMLLQFDKSKKIMDSTPFRAAGGLDKSNTFEAFSDNNRIVYYTTWNNVRGCVVHSSKRTSTKQEYRRNSLNSILPIDFGAAKVEIPFGSDTWSLVAKNVILDNKNDRFIAVSAKLYNSDGIEVVSTGELYVPIKNPSKYHINLKED